MSAATANLSQFRRTTIFDSLVSKEIHDQGEMFKNISHLNKPYKITFHRRNFTLLGVQYCDNAPSHPFEIHE